MFAGGVEISAGVAATKVLKGAGGIGVLLASGVVITAGTVGGDMALCGRGIRWDGKKGTIGKPPIVAGFVSSVAGDACAKEERSSTFSFGDGAPYDCRCCRRLSAKDFVCQVSGFFIGRTARC